jgi:putative sigma-54 modulation protein
LKDKISITSKHFEVSDKLKSYINKKMMKLVRYIPRSAKESLTIEVNLRENAKEKTNKFEAEGIFNLPEKQITAHDATINMFAAVDILESKLKSQLTRYKDEHTTNVASKSIRKLRRLLGRQR